MYRRVNEDAIVASLAGLISSPMTGGIRTQAFTDAEQLLLRPGTARVGAAS
jgi:hypothetical protein